MGLPYSYRSFYQTEVSPHFFYAKLTEKSSKYQLKNINFDKNEIKFSFSPNFFGIKNQVLIEFKTDFSGFYYEFPLENLIKISLILIIVFAFILHGIKKLLIFPSVSIFVLYSAVIIQTKSYLETLFDVITEQKEVSEELSEEQKKWLRDKNLCPACGAQLTEYDSFCPECRLNLKNYRKAKKQQVSRTGFEDFRIIYSYKEAKNNDVS